MRDFKSWKMRDSKTSRQRKANCVINFSKCLSIFNGYTMDFECEDDSPDKLPTM